MEGFATFPVACSDGSFYDKEPTWSLPALLDVMPRNPSITYHLFSSMMPKDVNTTNGWICDRTEFIKVDEGTFHEGTKRLYECFKGDDPITAAYEMVVWLLEQGLIKKGDSYDTRRNRITIPRPLWQVAVRCDEDGRHDLVIKWWCYPPEE